MTESIGHYITMHISMKGERLRPESSVIYYFILRRVYNEYSALTILRKCEILGQKLLAEDLNLEPSG